MQRNQETREAKQVTKDYDRGYKESQKQQARARKMPKQCNADEEERKQKTLKKWAEFPNGYHKAMKYRPWQDSQKEAASQRKQNFYYSSTWAQDQKR